MQRNLVVEFAKMSGAGNDFIVVDNRFYNFSGNELSRIARQVCVRRLGIGADGILALSESTQAGTDYRMEYYNADGSEGTMCGNGARCLGRYAVAGGLSPGLLHFETASGPYSIDVPENRAADVRLFMNEPGDWRPNLSLASPVPSAVSGVHYIWTGTEHVVCLVEDVDGAPVTPWGVDIRKDAALAPAGANVNFVQVAGHSHLKVRTYEKGVEAETLACGTGAMASAFAAQRLGLVKGDAATITMRGGVLRVGLIAPYYLEGPATTVYRGTFELEPSRLLG